MSDRARRLDSARRPINSAVVIPTSKDRPDTQVRRRMSVSHACQIGVPTVTWITLHHVGGQTERAATRHMHHANPLIHGAHYAHEDQPSWLRVPGQRQGISMPV